MLSSSAKPEYLQAIKLLTSAILDRYCFDNMVRTAAHKSMTVVLSNFAQPKSQGPEGQAYGGQGQGN